VHQESRKIQRRRQTSPSTIMGLGRDNARHKDKAAFKMIFRSLKGTHSAVGTAGCFWLGCGGSGGGCGCRSVRAQPSLQMVVEKSSLAMRTRSSSGDGRQFHCDTTDVLYSASSGGWIGNIGVGVCWSVLVWSDSEGSIRRQTQTW
jgi:hypothetical protein